MKKSKINAAAEKDAVKETKTGAATETEKIKDSVLVAAESPAATENGGVADGNESERVRESERGKHISNEKNIAYLSETEEKESKNRINVEYERFQEDKAELKAEIQKAEERLAKSKEAYEKLLEQYKTQYEKK